MVHRKQDVASVGRRTYKERDCRYCTPFGVYTNGVYHKPTLDNRDEL